MLDRCDIKPLILLRPTWSKTLPKIEDLFIYQNGNERKASSQAKNATFWSQKFF